MALLELHGYRSNADYQQYRSTVTDTTAYERMSSIDKFSEYLENRGYTGVRTGAYGVVFQHPSIPYCVKLFKNDPAYIYFVKLVLGDPTNPFFPRFRGRFMRVEDYFAVRMEILKPLTGPMWKTIGPIVTAISYLRKLKPGDIETMETQYPGLFNTLKSLQDNQLSFILDWHKGNFMRRGDQIVITDPYCPSG